MRSKHTVHQGLAQIKLLVVITTINTLLSTGGLCFAVGPGSNVSEETFVLNNSDHTLEIDARTGQIVSMRAHAVLDQEFIATDKSAPAFVVQYLTDDGQYKQLSSFDAQQTDITMAEDQSQPRGRQKKITLRFSQVGDGGLALIATLKTSSDDRFTHCSLSIDNPDGLTITDVQFPFVVTRFKLGTQTLEQLLYPISSGQLITDPLVGGLQPDLPNSWQFDPKASLVSGVDHYPGLVPVQFLAYYNDRRGIYIACQDSNGAIKRIRPVTRPNGLRLGISHVGDWPKKGSRQLGYDIVLTTFSGDWYDAADIYRNWSQKQPWTQRPLHERTDLPEWLTDSPPHIIIRVQGETDEGPLVPNKGFTPLANAIPVLERLSKDIGSPILPVVMCWEQSGPWVYPDAFPPIGGADAFRRFTGLANERGWHVGVFGNGARWVTEHHKAGYDGTQYTADHHGEDTICRTATGELWMELWDKEWRTSFRGCMAAEGTRIAAVAWVKELTALGIDYVQYFDQSVGAVAFPCFSEEHEHSSTPGLWMTDATSKMLDTLDEVKTAEGRDLVYSVEFPPNEFHVPRFDICDVRVSPPGSSNYGPLFVPLYHYLYHEFILMNGGFGQGPEPYSLQTRNSYNFVIGEIGGAVITDDGRLLNRDTNNWAPFHPQVGSNDDSMTVLRRTTALRQRDAKPFVVYGRMLRPSERFECETMRWELGGVENEVPAVYHATWQSPNGRVGLALANWTNKSQTVNITDRRLSSRVVVHLSAEEMSSQVRNLDDGTLSITLPPLSCSLLEEER